MNLHRMHRLYILMWIRLPSRVMWLWMCRWLQMQVWRLKAVRVGREKDTAKWQEQIHRWEKENPLAMRRDRGISPQMIMEHINAQFPHSIYVTDVGQHQMWATQYLELDEQSQLITSGGLGTMGFGFPAAIGAKLQIQRNRSCVSREMADFR